MRDLANRSYDGRDKGLPKSVKFLVLVALVLSALFFLKDRFFSWGVSSSSVTLRDAPKGLTPVDVSETVSFDDEGISLVTERATFVNVSGDNAKASATRKYGDGTYSLSVNATLPVVVGDKYQVWIATNPAKLAGTLTGAGGSFSLIFRDTDKYSKVDQIWITREITDNDEKPERHILEGSF